MVNIGDNISKLLFHIVMKSQIISINKLVESHNSKTCQIYRAYYRIVLKCFPILENKTKPIARKQYMYLVG